MPPPDADPNPRIDAGAVVLDPLTRADADELFVLLGDPALYRYLDDAPPPSPEALRRTYARRERRVSPDGREAWLNWVVRGADGPAIGYVQATLSGGTRECWIAYVFATAAQGRGLAGRAVAVMIDFIDRRHAPRRLLASVDPANRRSIALLGRLGFALAPVAAGAERPGATSTEDLLYARALRD